MVISAPFTILQLLANCIRLAPSLALSSLLWRLGKYLVVDYSATNSIYVGAIISIIIVLILGIIICMASAGVWAGGPLVLLGVGFKILMRILEYGLIPNHNYVDPIEGEPIIEDGKILKPVAAKYPQRLYREEWDDDKRSRQSSRSTTRTIIARQIRVILMTRIIFQMLTD